MKPSQQFILYLYSTKNIVGSALGLLGLLLYFTGLIGSWWFVIVIGLYMIGVLVTPENPTYDLTLKNQMSVEELRAELEELIRKVRRKVPDDIFKKVVSIKESIISILPNLVDINNGDYNTYVIRQTALDYLPEALQNYMNLPPAYANLHPVKDGKTARQLLGEQLDLLDQSMQQIVDDIHHNDTEKLLIHGRFLQDKFRKDDLLAGVRS